jgi:hypothetical protein
MSAYPMALHSARNLRNEEGPITVPRLRYERDERPLVVYEDGDRNVVASAVSTLGGTLASEFRRTQRLASRAAELRQRIGPPNEYGESRIYPKVERDDY